MNTYRSFLLMAAFLTASSFVMAQAPPAGFSWDKNSPKVTYDNTKKFFEVVADAKLNAPANIVGAELSVQECVAGQPGVPNTAIAPVYYGANAIAVGGIWTFTCTPVSNGNSFIFSANKSYVIQFRVQNNMGGGGGPIPWTPLSPNKVVP